MSSLGGRKRRYKIVLLGEGRVGKTSIVLRYIRGQFSEAQQSTLQASYLDKTLTVNGQTVALSIWDTAGQERFHALGPIYYRDADGALLVYDITHADSFERVKHWVKELRSIVGSQIVIAIAGNKIDLEKSRAVEQAAAVGYTKSVDASHFSTSAKLNRGLDAAFLDITKRLIERDAKDGGSDGSGGDDLFGGGAVGSRSSLPRSGRRLVIVEEEAPPRSKGCC